MNGKQPQNWNRLGWMALLPATLLLASPVIAQDEQSNGNGRPKPASAQSQAEDSPPAGPRATNGTKATNPNETRRKLPDAGPVMANFNDVSVMDMIPFIVESTGKVVMPVRPMVLRNQKITLMNDELMPRSRLVDLLFQTFRQNGVAVIEQDNLIILNMLAEANGGEVPVLGPNEDPRDRTDVGTIVIKIFALTEAVADGVAEQIEEMLPDYAKLSVDPNSNQLILLADIALCQRVQELIDQLDRNYMQEVKRTFKLNYADATEVYDNVLELFEDDGSAGQAANRNTQRRRQPGGQPQQPTAGSPLPQAPLRLTVNTAQNTVSVIGERKIVQEIETLINTYWDLPRPEGSARRYELRYTDCIRVRDTLNELLGSGGGTNAAAAGRARAGGGGGGDVTSILGGIYKIEAFPDANSVLVLSKTEASLNFLDMLITEIDQPSEAGLPMVVELKHADAFHLAEQINALLAEAGAGSGISRPEQGLSGEGIQSLTDGGTGGGNDAGQADATFDFPWQRGRQADDRVPESPLIGKTRVVPISRQNALAVLAPASMRESMRDLIYQFDRPGRQVMIRAVIAEVELTDELALGLRVSNSGDILGGGNSDNRLGGTADFDGQTTPLLDGLFDTSVLDVGVQVNAVLQALNEQTNVRILQQPQVFTADNEEAQFFDGQDVPFLTDTQVTDNGGITESTDYRPVGIFLNARPRITVNRDVDLDVYLELSSVVPGQTQFGAFIIDRRVTETHVVLKNEQTIVLSGILTDREAKIRRKIPLLGDIPLIGPLFTSYEDSSVTTELIAFITPIVVEDPEENYENFNDDARRRLMELSRPLEQQLKDSSTKQKIREAILPSDVKATGGSQDD